MSDRKVTIGGVISQLFPHGFIHDHYFYILQLDEKRATDEFLAKIFFNDAPPELPDLTGVKLEKFRRYKKINKQIKRKCRKHLGKTKIPSKYVKPPFSPFDLFAIASTLLANSGAYHHFEAAFDRLGRADVPKFKLPRKVERVERSDIDLWLDIGQAWYEFKGMPSISSLPYGPVSKKREPQNFQSMTDFWLEITRCWDQPVHKIVHENDQQPTWWRPALALLAISDAASKDVGFRYKSTGNSRNSYWSIIADYFISVFTRRSSIADGNLAFKYIESISYADRDLVNVLPKSRTAQIGCTLRGLTHNLAKLPARGKIRVGWTSIDSKPIVRPNPVFNMLLIPYPYSIHSYNFEPTAINEDDGLRWGMFSLNIVPDEEEDEKFVSFVADLIRNAQSKLGAIHGLVLPELAISKATAERITNRIEIDFPTIELVCFGVREKMLRSDNTITPANGAYMGFFVNGKRKQAFFHAKHHRWRLTGDQIDMYDLSPSLDPSRVWWEDIRLTNRCIPFLVVRNKWTVTSLICEDLARNDPAREVVEAVGPNLVISLLMDGPQIKDRWSSRYATVLAEDPGSSVLSMSSFGLIERSNRKSEEYGFTPSNSFALWRDDRGKSTTISLDIGYHATAISITEFPCTDTTFDGRSDKRGISLRLTGIRQIRSSLYRTENDFPPWSSTKARIK